METDLSKVKEVKSLAGGADYANQLLETGDWVLLETKVVESQYWVAADRYRSIEAHLRKSSETIFVLGRIR